nr:MAG TPA: hypothetical protein [Caudoviricetes sp.]
MTIGFGGVMMVKMVIQISEFWLVIRKAYKDIFQSTQGENT